MFLIGSLYLYKKERTQNNIEIQNFEPNNMTRAYVCMKISEYPFPPPPPPTLNWIRALLVGRAQGVVLEGESSSEVPVTSGVPQGSVLGPLLFLLYLNDLPQNIQAQVRLFADDTAVYLAVGSSDDRDTLQADRNTLQEWELAWNMEFNPSKCQVLHITRLKHPLNTQYSLHGQVLEATDTAKYLGVSIAKDLS